MSGVLTGRVGSLKTGFIPSAFLEGIVGNSIGERRWGGYATKTLHGRIDSKCVRYTLFNKKVEKSSVCNAHEIFSTFLIEM